ncbi:MAG: ADP-glyceromanno-heptose 6-epimerase [Saprospiraceae bacterium]
MIILTGAAGFIGSCMLSRLNALGLGKDTVIVDDFYKQYKDNNTDNKQVREWVHRDIFLDWFEKTTQHIDVVIHLGARTDTTLMDTDVFDTLNVHYTKRIWNVCASRNIPLIYASSAATYGDGSLGFSDDHSKVQAFRPLNPYAISKQNIDVWILEQDIKPDKWIGCKFFNVYGPNEYHKGRMASVVFHAYKQIAKTGKMNLFKSHKKGIHDGEQKRDFIYINDVLDILEHMINSKDIESGIYNVGTGKARTFLDLTQAVFKAKDLQPNIEFIDTPIDIRDSYQYFTEAEMQKLRKSGFTSKFTSLEDGVDTYVRQYLRKSKYF